MTQHTLRSERLVLVRGDELDDEAVRDFFVRNVDHLKRWLPEAEPIANEPGFFDLITQRSSDELEGGREERWFFAQQTSPGRVIGYVFLTRFRRDGHRSCELSYGIDAASVGQGLMREATLRVLQHAKQTLGFTRVDARYSVDNTRSAVLLERLGFEPVGTARQHAWLNGAWQDHMLVTRVERDGPPA